MLSASIVSYLTNELHRLSPALVFGLVALLVFGEAALFIGFVLPGETSVIVAGVVASEGRVNVVLLCVVVVTAAIIGDSVGYALGRRLGPRLLDVRPLAKRRAALDRALDGLRRRGAIYVFIGRFTAFFRAIMPALAGMSGLKYRRFLAANAAGGLCWGVGYTLLGFYAGHALTSIERDSSWFAGAVLLGLIVFFVAFHFWRRRRERAQSIKSDGNSAQRLE